LRRTIRLTGWGLLALAVAALAVVVTVGAFRAHNDSGFNRWVGWATVAAVPLAALGILLVLWDKARKSMTVPDVSMTELEKRLAAVVLAEAQVTRSRLIGAGEPGDQAANVRFIRSSRRLRQAGGNRTDDLDSVLKYYQSLSPQRLVVLGEPGAGKSVLMMELLIQLLEARTHDPLIPVPVLISAAAYEADASWARWLARHLALRYRISAPQAARLIQEDRILPMVDGLDEMDAAGSKQGRASALVTALNASMQGRERTPAVVSCRRTEYEMLPRGLDRATHIKLLPLTADEASTYLRGQFLKEDEARRWKPVIDDLKDHPNGPMAAQLATPWRLTLALTAFICQGGDPAELLPTAPGMAGRTAKEYKRQVDDLLLSSYVPAAVRLHDLAGRYNPAQVERWLTALAGGLTWQADHGRSATDIELYQWWRPAGQRATRLVHMTLVVVLSAVVLTSIAVPGELPIMLLCALMAGMAPRPARLKLPRLTTLVRLRKLVSWLMWGLVIGSLAGLLGGFRFAVFLGLGVAMGAATWDMFVDDTLEAIGPRYLLRTDGWFGLACGLLIGLFLGFLVGSAIGLPGWLVFGLGGGLTAGLLIATTWTRYHVPSARSTAVRRVP
jgi:hypothetical protein